MVASGARRQGWPCLVTGAGAGRGPGKGGQWALVFAELSPSKTLQPLDKHDLIPPQGSNMKGRNKPGVGPTHPISQTGKPSHGGGGGRRKEDKRALRLWLSRPEFTASWVTELRGGAPENGQGPDPWWGSDRLWRGSQLGHSQLCALRNSVTFSKTQLPHLMEGPGSPLPGRVVQSLDITDQGQGFRLAGLKSKCCPTSPEGGSPSPRQVFSAMGTRTH